MQWKRHSALPSMYWNSSQKWKKKTFFWKDNWLYGFCSKDIAPNLFKLAKRKNRNVGTELTNDEWLHSLRQITSFEEIQELIQLGGLLSRVTLLNEIEDIVLWKRSNVTTYSAKSAYLFQFIGSQQDKVFLLNWKALALPKQKFLGWLILHQKILIAENMLIQHWECNWICPLCRGVFKDTDHLFRQCDFFKETWNRVSAVQGIQNNQTFSSLKDCMTYIMQNESKTEVRRKAGVLVKTWWHIWLQRNAKIFRGEEPDVQRTSHQIIQDIQESSFQFQPPRVYPFSYKIKMYGPGTFLSCFLHWFV